jgi:hypothetical protein
MNLLKILALKLCVFLTLMCLEQLIDNAYIPSLYSATFYSCTTASRHIKHSIAIFSICYYTENMSTLPNLVRPLPKTAQRIRPAHLINSVTVWLQ